MVQGKALPAIKWFGSRKKHTTLVAIVDVKGLLLVRSRLGFPHHKPVAAPEKWVNLPLWTFSEENGDRDIHCYQKRKKALATARKWTSLDLSPGVSCSRIPNHRGGANENPSITAFHAVRGAQSPEHSSAYNSGRRRIWRSHCGSQVKCLSLSTI
jgi:hypothetical protein